MADARHQNGHFALRCCERTNGIWCCFMQDFSKQEKRVLAVESRKAPPKYGSEAKQQIINHLHARMLAAEQASAHILLRGFIHA